MLENCTQTTRVYWSKNPAESLYICTRLNNLRLNERYLINYRIYPKFRWLLYQSVHHRLRYSYIGTICHHKAFTGRVLLLWKLFFTPKQLISSPKGFLAFAPSGTATQIARKSRNHRGQYWILNPMPENLGYRTQVWYNGCFAFWPPMIACYLRLMICQWKLTKLQDWKFVWNALYNNWYVHANCISVCWEGMLLLECLYVR